MDSIRKVGFRNILSKQEAISLLVLIQKSISCSKEDDFRDIVKGLNCLISYDFAIAGFAEIDDNSKIKSYNIVNISYPTEWLNLYITREYHQVDPIVKENFAKFGLQYWADTYKLNVPPNDFVSLAEDFGLKRGYTYGARNLKGSKGSLFSLSGKSIEHNIHTQIILEHIMPHFHHALSRILDQPYTRKKDIYISPREKEVLKWVREGKSTWDISVILGISERTVKFHVKNIMQELDAVNRSQAVAIAVQLRLIDIE
ncbi:MAG: LuxR C-terminal-related transcriptional regulator [Nitrospirota bacterium]